MHPLYFHGSFVPCAKKTTAMASGVSSAGSRGKIGEGEGGKKFGIMALLFLGVSYCAIAHVYSAHFVHCPSILSRRFCHPKVLPCLSFTCQCCSLTFEFIPPFPPPLPTGYLQNYLSYLRRVTPARLPPGIARAARAGPVSSLLHDSDIVVDTEEDVVKVREKKLYWDLLLPIGTGGRRVLREQLLSVGQKQMSLFYILFCAQVDNSSPPGFYEQGSTSTCHTCALCRLMQVLGRTSRIDQGFIVGHLRVRQNGFSTLPTPCFLLRQPNPPFPGCSPPF